MFNIFSVHVISLIVAGLAVVAVFVYIPFVSDYAFWFLVAAYIMLAGHRWIGGNKELRNRVRKTSMPATSAGMTAQSRFDFVGTRTNLAIRCNRRCNKRRVCLPAVAAMRHSRTQVAPLPHSRRERPAGPGIRMKPAPALADTARPRIRDAAAAHRPSNRRDKNYRGNPRSH